MSKRTLIITGIAVLMVLAAVFSIYMEKKQLVDLYEGMEPDEGPEPDEEPEPEEKPKRSPGRPPKKENLGFTVAEEKPEEKPKRSPGRPPNEEYLGFTVAEEKPANEVENETGKTE